MRRWDEVPAGEKAYWCLGWLAILSAVAAILSAFRWELIAEQLGLG